MSWRISAVALLLASVPALATPTTESRDDFITRFIRACGQSTYREPQAPSFAGVSAWDRLRLCGCEADHIWPLLTDDEVWYERTYHDETPSMLAKMREVARQCARETLGR